MDTTAAPSDSASADASVRPTLASPPGGSLSDPSGPSAPTLSKRHDFVGTNRIVTIPGRDKAVLTPTRLELAATFASKRREEGLDMIIGTQF